MLSHFIAFYRILSHFIAKYRGYDTPRSIGQGRQPCHGIMRRRRRVSPPPPPRSSACCCCVLEAARQGLGAAKLPPPAVWAAQPTRAVGWAAVCSAGRSSRAAGRCTPATAATALPIQAKGREPRRVGHSRGCMGTVFFSSSLVLGMCLLVSVAFSVRGTTVGACNPLTLVGT